MTDTRTIETIIRGTLADMGLSAAGLSFHHPDEWRARGERYANGPRTLLVITYEGASEGASGADAFEYDRENYEAIERMTAALDAVGVYSECATSWYSGIYPAHSTACA